MKYLLTPQQMRFADAYGINSLNIPSLILMENAARSAAEIIRSIIANQDTLSKPRQPRLKITILCGSGNNGGDGFAIARHLHQQYDVRIAWVGAKQKMSPETRRNFSICTKLGIEMIALKTESWNFGIRIKEEQKVEYSGKAMTMKGLDARYPTLFHCDIIIDALIGIGTSSTQQIGSGELVFFVEPQSKEEIAARRELRGITRLLVQKANVCNALRIAIDMPTGLGDGGKAGEVAFRAHHTITMAALKTTLLLNDAWDYCGQLHIADIGLPEYGIAKYAQAGVLEESDVRQLLPARKRNSSKFDYGRVCVIAGSNSMPGAAALCANAALRSGAGLVELCTTTLHPALLPEVMPTLLPTTATGQLSPESLPQLLESCAKADSIVIGCGLGNDELTLSMIQQIIDNMLPYKKIVLDADGLRVLPKLKTTSRNLIITPHVGEFKRTFAQLIGNISKEELIYHLPEIAAVVAKSADIVVALKSFPVLVTKGEYSYWCYEGNPGMATAGSGDVLAGVLGALVNRISNSFDAAAAAVWIHARAGHCAAQKNGEESLTASAICDNLQFVFPR